MTKSTEYQLVDPTHSDALLAQYLTVEVVNQKPLKELAQKLLIDMDSAIKTVQVEEPPADTVGGWRVMNDLVSRIPGIYDEVACPWLGCVFLHRGQTATVAFLIQHLNDQAHWSREQIADWLETLDADLTFSTEPLEVKPTPPKPTPHSTIIFYDSLVAAQKQMMHYVHMGVIYGASSKGSKKSYWYGAHTSALWWNELQKPDPWPGWPHGSLDAACSKAPQLPSYDTLRAKSKDVPPDPLERVDLTWERTPRDLSKYSDHENTPPTKKKKRKSLHGI